MKKGLYIVFLCGCISCQYIGLQAKEESQEPTIASVYNYKLYKSDIQNLIPKKISKQDSLMLMQRLINSWAKQQLLLKKAKENATEVNNKEINYLVEEYRKSLFINSYKERLVKQQLDTVIAEPEIEQYYEKNKQNFRLNKTLLQLKYIHLGIHFLDKVTVIRQFKSDKQEDVGRLEKQELKFKSYRLSDSTWLDLDKVLSAIPPLAKEPKEKWLKTSKFMQKQDSLGVYLVIIKKLLKPNDIAPLGYITPAIREIILHKRKLAFIRKIEKTLIDDAIENNHFKTY